MSQISPLFARQPIFNKDMQTVAYELLFRGSSDNQAQFIDGDHATSHVLFYAFGQNRVEEVIGEVPAFINFTPQLLVYPPPMPPEKLVVEVLETVKADKLIIDGIKKLKSEGYKIALDDFFLNPQTKTLLKYADIIKVDVMALNDEQLKAHMRYLTPLNLTLLAEKIETKECFDLCVKLGFTLFQGFFLAKPEIIEGQKISESKQAVLNLLATIMADDVEFDEVVNAISADPRLSYRILKIVNSTAYNIPRTIESLNQAVGLLGLNQIRNWAAILLLTGEEQCKPKELSLLCMTRAKFCEGIGRKLRHKQLAEGCFTAGLLSTFDAFLNIPLHSVVQQLSLSESLNQALLQHQGTLGQILLLCIHYENANWEQVAKSPFLIHGVLSETCLNQCYIAASKWALESLSGF